MRTTAITALVLGALCLPAAAPALAAGSGDAPPPCTGNEKGSAIVNGKDQQPSGDVDERRAEAGCGEGGAGINDKQAHEVDDLYKELTGKDMNAGQQPPAK